MTITLNGTTGITTPAISSTGASTFTGALALPSGGLTVGTDQLAVDSAGRVTMPYQPAVFAQRTGGSISGNSTIPFDNLLVNTGGHYSSATGRFTAPVGGVYQVICHGIIGNNGSAANSDFKVLKNGSAYASGHNNHTDVWDNSVVQCNVSLAVNDYIEIYFYGTSTTSFYGANPSSQAYNGLSIHLIG